MAIFKCKMCGGSLDVQPNASVAECEYCGTRQTLPKTNDDVVANLFNRANNLRLKCEFDKAAQIYEKIVEQDSDEAEAYWGMVLCKYGIEYVEDPKTMTRVPTCHRTLYEAVTADADYLAAMEHANTAQRDIYEKEAQAIDRIQKDILAVVKNEKPFDVFICYKESDDSGKRTVDSSIANDIYHQLTQEGFKVFYAAITLEDKLGQEYEPYIFAALNSAKVMLVLGTKPEYFSAVWVRNEWSRFLQLMKSDRSKLLIPCYRDMDAYDLPEEFAHLQAQDMGKIGFINDVVRGIRKVMQTEKPKTTVVKETVVTTNANTAPLLERAFMFLEDGDWQKADEFCEQVLNLDPKCTEAYLGKLMADLRVRKQEELKNCEQPFDNNGNYQKILRFGDEKLTKKLTDAIEFINTRNENARLEGIYQEAIDTMRDGQLEYEFLSAAELFEAIQEYKDSEAKAKECREKAEIERKNGILADGKEEKSKTKGDPIENLKTAIGYFETIPGWKDADEQLRICKERIEEIIAKEEADRLERERKAEEAKKQAEAQRKKAIKLAKILVPAACVIIAFLIVLNSVIIPNGKYNKAVELMEAGNYEEADTIFQELGQYKDANEYVAAIVMYRDYDNAVELLNGKAFCAAQEIFLTLGDFEDSAMMEKEARYQRLCALLELYDEYRLEIDMANVYILNQLLNDTDEVGVEVIPEYEANEAVLEEAWKKYSGEHLPIWCYYDVPAHGYIPLMDYIADGFTELEDYKDAKTKVSDYNEKKKDEAVALMEAGSYEEAYDVFVSLRDYENTESFLKDFKVVYKTQVSTDHIGNKTIYEYSYDAAGNLIKEVINSSFGGKSAYEYSYDAAGKMIKKVGTTSLAPTYEYSYDTAGNMIKEVGTYYDGDKSTSEFFYDVSGNMIKEVYSGTEGDGYTYEYSYDTAGNLIKEVQTSYSPILGSHLRTYEYSYDAYDAAGNMIKMTSGNDIYEYSYDAAGNLIKEVHTGFNGSKTISEYSYDAVGNLIKEVTTYPNGSIKTQEYIDPIVFYNPVE